MLTKTVVLLVYLALKKNPFEFRSEAEAEAAADCWNKVCIGSSVLDVKVVPPSSNSDLDNSFTCSETTSSVARFKQGPPRNNWKRTGKKPVTREQLDNELDQYMKQRK